MNENVIKAALLGFGTVGTGVYKVLKNQEKEMSAKIGCKVEIKKILVRNIEKAAAKIEDASLLTSQWDEIINDPEIEIVIELMGGINPAKEYILSALKAGKHVVSANKDLIAVHGHELLDAAHESKVDFLFEAAVADHQTIETVSGRKSHDRSYGYCKRNHKLYSDKDDSGRYGV